MFTLGIRLDSNLLGRIREFRSQEEYDHDEADRLGRDLLMVIIGWQAHEEEVAALKRSTNGRNQSTARKKAPAGITPSRFPAPRKSPARRTR